MYAKVRGRCLACEASTYHVYILAQMHCLVTSGRHRAPKGRLKEPPNLSSLGVNIDIKVSGRSRQTGDGLDVRSQSVEVAGTSSHAHIPDRDGEATRRSLEVGIMAKRVLRLGHADRQAPEPLAGVRLNLGLGKVAEFDLVGTIHFTRDLLDALFHSSVEIVKETEVLGLLGSSKNPFGELNSTLTALSPMV